jgi:type II secretory pathway component PulF
MTRQKQFQLAIVTVVFTLVAIAATVYLSFFFPKTVALWADQQRVLSLLEQIVASLSIYCRSFGLFLLPFFGVVFAIGGMWMAATASGKDAETTEQ